MSIYHAFGKKMTKMVRKHVKSTKKRTDLEAEISDLRKIIQEMRDKQSTSISKDEEIAVVAATAAAAGDAGAKAALEIDTRSILAPNLGQFVYRFLTLAIAFFISGLWGTTIINLLNRHLSYDDCSSFKMIFILIIITVIFIFFVWWFGMDHIRNAF